MPTIKEILQEERNRESANLVLFLEGKFWKAYEKSAYAFKMVYDLLLRIVHEAHKMGKDFRYTLGEDLKRLLVRVEVCVYHANEKKEANDKLAYINEALEKMLEVKLYVRILHDSKQLSLKKYAMFCEQMVAIEKQLTDWNHYYSLKINKQ